MLGFVITGALMMILGTPLIIVGAVKVQEMYGIGLLIAGITIALAGLIVVGVVGWMHLMDHCDRKRMKDAGRA